MEETKSVIIKEISGTVEENVYGITLSKEEGEFFVSAWEMKGKKKVEEGKTPFPFKPLPFQLRKMLNLYLDKFRIPVKEEKKEEKTEPSSEKKTSDTKVTVVN